MWSWECLKTIKVVAAIIENDRREVLCALRSPHMSMPNLWEFPGGKVEAGEDIHSALKREIQEELGCEVETGEVLNRHAHDYGSFIVDLIAIKCKLRKGTPIPSEHAKLVWLSKEQLSRLEWAPADIPAVKMLINELANS